MFCKSLIQFSVDGQDCVSSLLFESESENGSVVSDSLQPHGLYSHGILQAKILEWIAFPFSRGSSQPRDRTQVSCIAGRRFPQVNSREGTQLHPSTEN